MDSGSCVYELTDDDIKRSRLPCTSLHFIPPTDEKKTDNIILATCERIHCYAPVSVFNCTALMSV